jgi:hypothetical protein
VKFLQDTDSCFFALRHHPDVRFLFAALTPEDVVISAIPTTSGNSAGFQA